MTAYLTLVAGLGVLVGPGEVESVAAGLSGEVTSVTAGLSGRVTSVAGTVGSPWEHERMLIYLVILCRPSIPYNFLFGSWVELY